MGNKGTLGLGGDHDYDSVIGWEPERTRKKKAAASSDGPSEMLHCRSMNGWMRTVLESLPEYALFRQFWLLFLLVLFFCGYLGKNVYNMGLTTEEDEEEESDKCPVRRPQSPACSLTKFSGDRR